MKQTAMMQLLSQLKDERANLPMNIEWDRCYQAIEMLIQDIYITLEEHQIRNAYLDGQDEIQEQCDCQTEHRLTSLGYYNKNYKLK